MPRSVNAPVVQKSCRSLQQVRGLHESQVGEALREVADVSRRRRVVLLGQEPQFIAQPQQLLEQCFGLVGSALKGVDVREPEAARQEVALIPGQAVVAEAGVVATHQTAPHQGLLDRLDG